MDSPPPPPPPPLPQEPIRSEINSHGGPSPICRVKRFMTDLILWKSPAISAMVLIVSFAILIALRVMSTVRFLSGFTILIMVGVLIYRTIRYVCVDVLGISAFPSTQLCANLDECPIRELCSHGEPLQFTNDHARYIADSLVKHGNTLMKHCHEIILWNNVPQSLGSLVLLSIVFSVSRCIHPISLLIISLLISFSVPFVYISYQKQIDQTFDKAKHSIRSTLGKLPGFKSKAN
ncbi:hypothetical protein ACOME3_001615 [Neoechinorhynchus agilis]